jgi:hypothetical protein
MTIETLEIIEGILSYYLSIQIMFSILVLLLDRVVLDIYETGIYEKPENAFQRILTFCMNAILGVGPTLNKKFLQYSWIKRKTLMVLSIFVLFWVAVVFYYVVKNLLRAIFL